MTRDEFVSRFKVGDKIKLGVWEPDRYAEIIFIGNERFFYNNESGFEHVYPIDQDWLPYAEPQKKKTVKMARALAQNNNGRFYISDFLYSSKEEAISFLGKLIQWPLVINNEEQWIEVEVEE